MQMELSPNSRVPDGLLAAMTLLSEKPHQGLPSWESALHQGIDERNCTALLGLQFRSSEIVSGTVVAPNNGPTNPRATQCKIKVGVGIGLDVAGTAAGLVPGAGAALVTTQVSLGLASAAYSAYNGSAAFTIGNATGAQLSAVAAGAEYVGWKTAAKALPWIGTLYNAGALAYDVYHAQSDYQACLAGG
jgi:hypothetical protein